MTPGASCEFTWILSGAVGPSGRLPVTFPASVTQLPHPVLPGDPKGAPLGPVGRGGSYGRTFTADYSEGAAVGYKWFAEKGERPDLTVLIDQLSATLPAYGIEAHFMGPGTGTLEIFTFTDAEILDGRLEGRERRLDHVAFRVEGLDALLATLRASGARFCTPDRSQELAEPIEVGPNRQIWTVPESTGGLALQLNEPLAR